MADSKRKKAAREKLDTAKAYVIEDALNLVKELATAKFPESGCARFDGAAQRHREDGSCCRVCAG